MKLLFISGIIGLVIGVAITAFYFSLATFFAVHAKALDALQKRSGSRNATIDRRKGGDRRKAG
jgi:hypothetical protein